LDATTQELEKVRKMVAGGRLKGKKRIGLQVGTVINKYRMAKHIDLEIQDTLLSRRIKDVKVREECVLDGI